MGWKSSTGLRQGWRPRPQIAPANCRVDFCHISLSALRSNERRWPVQTLVFGNRQALPRDRPCLSLYNQNGVTAIPRGLERALLIAKQILDGEALEIPEEAAKAVLMLSQQAFDTHSRIQGIDRDLQRWHCSNGLSRRLATIPGIGPIGASALAASYQPS